MKTLIYQCWTGNNLSQFARVSKEKFQLYSKHIGADYFCDRYSFDVENDNYYDLWYNFLTPIFDKKYQKYDRILLVEMDVYPSRTKLDNIFDQSVDSVGMAKEFKNSYCYHPMEKDMNILIQANIEGWGFYVTKKLGRSLPRDEKGNFNLYNSGVILLTRSAIEKLHNNLTREDVREYIKDIYRSNLPMASYFTKPCIFLQYSLFRLGLKITTLNDTWNYQRSDYDVYTNKSLSTPNFIHLRTSKKHKLKENIINQYINELYVKKLVIGCGRLPKEGWINSDYLNTGRKNWSKKIIAKGYQFKEIDVSKVLPFDENDLSFIFSEHVLEHLPEEVGKYFLSEAYRVLKPRGVIRTVVPDKDFYLNLKDDDEYVKLYIDYCKKNDNTDVDYFPGVASLITKRCLSIQITDHHWVPTLDMLIKQHEGAGFKVKVCNYFESDYKALKNLEVDDRMRVLESIVVEGTK